MKGLIVVQYNYGHTNGKASRALFDSFTAPTVIAIQEPLYNERTKSTYYLKLYQLVYDALLETRVYFMIKREVYES